MRLANFAATKSRIFFAQEFPKQLLLFQFQKVPGLCMNHLSRSKRRKEDSIDEMVEEEGQSRIPVETVNPEQGAVQRDIEVRIGKALQRLRPKEREIIILQHFQDYSYQEIAAC